jgi:hypothetical protein
MAQADSMGEGGSNVSFSTAISTTNKKARLSAGFAFVRLVAGTGFEPATFGL